MPSCGPYQRVAALAALGLLGLIVPVSGGGAAASTGGPEVCRVYPLPAASKPVEWAFAQTTTVALVQYVGASCLTVYLAGGPKNPNPTARSIGSVTVVDVEPTTVFVLGGRRTTIKAVKAGDELLALTGRGYGTLYAASRIVVLPPGETLPLR